MSARVAFAFGPCSRSNVGPLEVGQELGKICGRRRTVEDILVAVASKRPIGRSAPELLRDEVVGRLVEAGIQPGFRLPDGGDKKNSKR